MIAYVKNTTETSLFEQGGVNFRTKGYAVVYYTERPHFPRFDRTQDVIVGFPKDLAFAIGVYEMNPFPFINYPKQLTKYLHRTIDIVEKQDIPDNYSFFIKPMYDKEFLGRVAYAFKDLIGIKFNPYYICTQILNIISEYRGYVINGQLIGIKHYKGSPFVVPFEEVINQMLQEYSDAPNAYALDIGVLDSGETILIEVNNALTSGNYGLSDWLYASFLKAGFEILL